MKIDKMTYKRGGPSTISTWRMGRLTMILVAMATAMTLPSSLSAAGLRIEHVQAGGDIQRAIDSLPAQGGEVRIAPGVYRGRLRIGKAGVRLIGEGQGPADVRIVADASAATAGSLYASATVHVAGDDFRAENISVVNDWEARGRGSSQAIALAVSADRARFDRVVVSGGQDSLYLARPIGGATTRQLFRDCRIEGHVDFIFGNAKAYFDRCVIHGIAHEKIIYTAPSANHGKDEGGFVFHACTFTADAASEVWLGRPWRPYARVILIDSKVEPPLSPGGWREWKPGLTNDTKTVQFAEQATTYAAGPPRQSKIRQLSAQEARQWTLDAFMGGDSDWTR